MSIPSVPHQPGRMADVMGRTQPLPTAPRSRHRAPRPRVDVHTHLLTLALGALLAVGIYLAGGPW